MSFFGLFLRFRPSLFGMRWLCHPYKSGEPSCATLARKDVIHHHLKGSGRVADREHGPMGFQIVIRGLGRLLFHSSPSLIRNYCNPIIYRLGNRVIPVNHPPVEVHGTDIVHALAFGRVI